MSKGIRVGLAKTKTGHLIIGIILLVLAGRGFNTNAQTVTILYQFVGTPTDGAYPYAELVQGNDGNFYGTTYLGGTNGFCNGGCGTMFRITPGGGYTMLYQFGSPGDGANPQTGLVQGGDGNFYGTTLNVTYVGEYTGGTVFRISPSGNETNLYTFLSQPNDGHTPRGTLVRGNDGNFYGTTFNGGTNDEIDGGDGTIFRISPSGSETILYSFGSYPGDGADPEGGLVPGSDGNFYGTTVNGGRNGDGTIFRFSASGTYTSLYSFVGPPTDGVNPAGELAQGSDGNFYGTTFSGGIGPCSDGCGTVFRISASGSETNLYLFGGPPNDGIYPRAGLVQGSDGNFYGTTIAGGTNNEGTVFRISPSGTYTQLYSFVNSPANGYENFNAWAGLIQGSDGNLYGTTVLGGTNNMGTVFKVVVPLNPPPYPMNQITNVQVAAQNIIFGIPSIAGETYQLQFTTDLTSGNWINEGGTITSIGALMTLTNFGGAVGSQGFYRFAITP